MRLDEGLNFWVRVPWRGDLPLIADNPRALSSRGANTCTRGAFFSQVDYFRIAVIQEDRLTNLNEPSLNSYLTC
jgi:hypothetical protein